MTFISFQCYVFLAIAVSVYYLIPVRFRWYSLLASSLIFYWYLSQRSIAIFLMLVVEAAICWGLSWLIVKNTTKRKFWVLSVVSVIALPLLAIKEEPYITTIILHRPTLEGWLVPVGIAFYSMQLISYSVDVYKEKIKPEKNFLKFLLFVSYFPQIIQGPIPRYAQLAHQLQEGHRFDERKFVKGFMLIIWGFFLKLCIADKAAVIVNTIFDNYMAYQGLYVLVAGVLYSFQLYTDFLACTSFTQGISGLFGIDIVDNFNHPYFSVSIKDFWRRWHISLSSWLRDYIYIPAGGNRKGKLRKYINILLTFAVSGIWHGSGYKFLFWGLLVSDE